MCVICTRIIVAGLEFEAKYMAINEIFIQDGYVTWLNLTGWVPEAVFEPISIGRAQGLPYYHTFFKLFIGLCL